MGTFVSSFNTCGPPNSVTRMAFMIVFNADRTDILKRMNNSKLQHVSLEAKEANHLLAKRLHYYLTF